MEEPTVRTIKDWLIKGIEELPKEAPKDRFRKHILPPEFKKDNHRKRESKEGKNTGRFRKANEGV